MQVRRTAAAFTSAAALTVTGVAMATPAGAAPNTTTQNGLINLALTDTDVQVPIAVAANICQVPISVLSAGLVSGPVECDADSGATAVSRDGGPNTTRQRGLVNVAVTDTTVQVPVGVAANVCGVSVNLLTQLNLVGPTTCTAIAEAIAEEG